MDEKKIIDWSVIADLRRKLNDWSQADLMRASGLSKAGICVLEQGQRNDPRASTVYKLATALELTTDELFVAAGYEPTVSWPEEFSPSDLHLVRLLQSMDAEGQRMLLDLAGSLSRIRAQDAA